MQSGLPADAASLRETGSVDRYIYTAWALAAVTAAQAILGARTLPLCALA